MAYNLSSIYRRFFHTFHRRLLDKHLNIIFPEIHGNVLVLGAGYNSYSFLKHQCSSVVLSDIHVPPDSNLHYIDAHNITFPDSSFDFILAIEVLEHLFNPALAASEICRVLRPGGTAVLSSPFMFRIHADPCDYHRFTKSALTQLFPDCSVVVTPFGNRIHVILDLLSTTHRFFAFFRIFNRFLDFLVPDIASDDAPSGYIILVNRV